jgi:hypothetical protein
MRLFIMNNKNFVQLYYYTEMGFFKKAGQDIDSAFSKGATRNTMRKLNQGYRDSLPYTKAIGGVAGDLAPLATIVAPPIGFALKATSATAKAYGAGERFLPKNKTAVMPNSIQASKPVAPQADIFQ